MDVKTASLSPQNVQVWQTPLNVQVWQTTWTSISCFCCWCFIFISGKNLESQNKISNIVHTQWCIYMCMYSFKKRERNISSDGQFQCWNNILGFSHVQIILPIFSKILTSSLVNLPLIFHPFDHISFPYLIYRIWEPFFGSHAVWYVSYQSLSSSWHADLDYGSYRLSTVEILRAHKGCDRSTGDAYSSMAPDYTSHLFRDLCTPILWFASPIGLMRLITVYYFCHFIEFVFLCSLHENPLVRRPRPVNLRSGQWKLKMKKSDWLLVFIKLFMTQIYFRGPVKIFGGQ
jgi:hypothetical protein